MRPFRFADVHRKILEQHEEIRARIEGLEQSSRRDLPLAQQAVRVLLLRFAAKFDTHLGFEERELAPRIREVDAWGYAREAALRAEHREQRKRLEQVFALAEEPLSTDDRSLSVAISDLAGTLREEILAEEHMLEELARIDEVGHCDQMTG